MLIQPIWFDLALLDLHTGLVEPLTGQLFQISLIIMADIIQMSISNIVS